jgi:hypothetical protein
MVLCMGAAQRMWRAIVGGLVLGAAAGVPAPSNASPPPPEPVVAYDTTAGTVIVDPVIWFG